MLAAHCRVFALLLAPILLFGRNPYPPLTVLMDFESPHSEVALASLGQGLNRILRPAGLSVNLRIKEDLPDHPQFGRLVIFRMKGSCTMAPLPIGALSDERGPLAMAYVTDGQILSFGEVECDHVRHSLQRILGANGSRSSQQRFGSALAVVIAHELYHMLGNAKRHTHEGLTKPALTASELMDDTLSLPPGALAEIEKAFDEIAP